MKVGVILFFGVTAGLLCCHINGQFPPNVMELQKNNIWNFLDNSIILLSDFNHRLEKRYTMSTQQFQNVHPIAISQTFHPKLANRKLEKNKLKRIVRNANSILKKNGTDPQPKMTSSISTETIQNQTEQYLNVSIPDMLITGTNMIQMITTPTTYLNNYTEKNNVITNLAIKENFNSSKSNNISMNQNNTDTLKNSPTIPLINNYTEQHIATTTDDVIKENILLPISSDQKMFFYDPLKIFSVFSITLLIAGTLFYIYKRLQARGNVNINCRVGGMCGNYQETTV